MKEFIKIKEMKVVAYVLVVLLFLLIFYLGNLVGAVEPYGANYTGIKSESAPLDSPQSIPAQAGNVTEINIFGYSTTQSWQGYFGNVSGTIQLADVNDNVMYNWSLASPEGEVYASENSSVDWTNVACFEMGNHTALETYYNISKDDVDGVNETFSIGNGHDIFYTSNTQFTEGQCPSTQIYDSSGKGVDNSFEEILLTDQTDDIQVIFTALLEEDMQGFDSGYHDFEMIVLENGHGANTALTNYYFYVELQ